MIPKIVVTVALMAIQAAMTASQQTYGPRLDDLSVSLADYGAQIPRVFGVRRIEGQMIWAEDLREVDQTSKGKGGKQTSYIYYGTWASIVCDQDGHDVTAFDQLTKVWFDKQLVYDTTAATPVSIGALFGDNTAIKLNNGSNMRVYLGTNSQLPDPRIEAWCEDKYGAGTCPAYRLSGYVVFQDIPLEKVGNRIPQVTFEVIKNPVPKYPYAQVNSVVTEGAFDTSPNGNWLVNWQPGKVDFWDTATRTLVGSVATTFPITGDYKNIAVDDTGIAYLLGPFITPTQMHFVAVSPTGGSATPIPTAPTSAFTGPTRVLNSSAGQRVLTATTTGIYYDSANFFVFDATSTPRDFCVDDSLKVWAVAQPMGSSNQFSLWTNFGLLSAVSHTFTGAVTRSGPTDAHVCFANGKFFVLSDGHFYIIDPATWTIVASGTTSSNPGKLPINTSGATTYWETSMIGVSQNMVQYSLVDGSLVQSLSSLLWSATEGAIHSGGIFDDVNHAYVINAGPVGSYTNHLTWYFVDRVTSGGTELKDVVDAVSRWCGVSGADTSALTQIVQGYSVTQGSGKDMLAPLLDIYDVDPACHDFDIKYVNRGSAPSGSTLLTQDFAITGKDAKRYTVTIQQDTDLPQSLTFNFADLTLDDQPNTARSARNAESTNTTRDQTIDLTTFEDTPSGAQQKADRFFRRIWNSKERTSHSLTYQNITLEPADVRTISLDGALRNVRLDKLTIRKDHIECEWVRDETSFAQLNNATGAPLDGNNGDTIFIPAPTKGFVFDMPNISDAEDSIKPLVHVAGGAYDASAWPGAYVYDGTDGTFDTQVETLGPSQEAKWGLCNGTLPNVNPNLWDMGNTLNVTMKVGTLTSYTQAQVDADGTLNLVYVWQELLQFATATLNGDGTYTLSGFKRGRRGTEWAVGLHGANETILVASTLTTFDLSYSDIGEAKSYKVQTIGRDPGAVAASSFTFLGDSARSYAPGFVQGVRDLSNNNWVFTWDRRSRVGGNWNGSAIPLPEGLENYELVIMNGSAEKRSIMVTSPTATYTPAQQVADFGANQSTVTIRLYQRSSNFGRGFPASLSFTG